MLNSENRMQPNRRPTCNNNKIANSETQFSL